MCNSCNNNPCKKMRLPINSFKDVKDDLATFETVLDRLADVQEVSNKAINSVYEFQDYLEGDGLPQLVDSSVKRLVNDELVTDTIKEELDSKATRVEVSLKADKVTVDNALNDISVRQINKNRGKIDQTYLTEDLLQQIAGTAPINAVPANNSITLNKTTFSKTSKNLFDKDVVTTGFYVDSASGNLIANATFAVSDFIPIEPNTEYFKPGAYTYAFYTQNNVYISGGTSSVITSPADGYNVRISVPVSLLDSYQFEKGNTSTPYVAFKEVIESKYLEPQIISGDDIPDKTITIQKLKNTEYRKNLVDVAEIIDFKYVTVDGTLLESTALSTTDFMPVEGDRSYVASKLRSLAFYDADKGFISFVNDVAYSSNVVVLAPTNAKYARLSFRTEDKGIIQFEKGSAATPYEKYGFELKNLVIKSTNVDGLEFASVSDIYKMIVIPSKIHAISTMPTDVYFDSIISKVSELDVDVESSVGKQLGDSFQNPSPVVGTQALTISTYKDGSLVGTRSSSVVSVDPNTNDKAYSLITIGDSTTRSMTASLLANFNNDTGSTLTLQGTKTDPTGFKYEGYAGWTSGNLMTLPNIGDVTNSFYNPATQGFDFSYYMTQNNFTLPTMVVLNLGINDIYGATSYDTLVSTVNSTLTNLSNMTSSIKGYNNNIKVLITLQISPNSNQNAFGNAYGCGKTQWFQKRSYVYFTDALIKRFDNREGEGIFLSATNVVVDPQTQIADAVHPTTIGYENMGTQLYKSVKVIG